MLCILVMKSKTLMIYLWAKENKMKKKLAFKIGFQTIIIASLFGFLVQNSLIAGKLHDAVKSGDFNKVEELLSKKKIFGKKRFDVNEWDSNGDTPLLCAVFTSKGNEAIAQLLLDHGAEINRPTRRGGRTPLHVAALYGPVGLVNFLLERGADINAQGLSGKTPFYVAATKCNEGILRLLFKGNDEDIIRLLFSRGADPNVKRDGRTALHDLAKAYQNVAKPGKYTRIIREEEEIIREREKKMLTMQLLLELGASPEIQDEENHTVLHWAAYEGEVDVVKLLLDHGADIEAQTHEYDTPLSLATFHTSSVDDEQKRKNHISIIKMLLEHGAHVNVQEKNYGFSPLYHAVSRGDVLIAQMLLDHGADVDIRDRLPVERPEEFGEPLLCRAARNGDLEVVRLLLQHGADPMVRTEKGLTSAAIAYQQGYGELGILLTAGTSSHLIPSGLLPLLDRIEKEYDIEKVKALFSQGKINIHEKDERGFTLLHWAVSRGNAAIATRLLQHGADPTAKTNTGLLPDTIARRCNNWELAALLAKAAADYVAPSDLERVLREKMVQGDAKRVQELFSRGEVNVNATNDAGCTLLHAAAQSGKPELVRLCLERGGQQEIGDNEGATPLHHAAFLGHTDVAQMLLASEADKDAKNKNGYTPLHFAVLLDHTDVARLLLEAGAQKELPTNDGFTPLHFAVQTEETTAAKMLLAYGANPAARTSQPGEFMEQPIPAGSTPTDIARLLKHSKVVGFLEDVAAARAETRAAVSSLVAAQGGAGTE